MKSVAILSLLLCIALSANALLTVPYAVVAGSGLSGSYTGTPSGTKTVISLSAADYAGSAALSSNAFGPSSGSASLQSAKLDITGSVTTNCPGINMAGSGVNGNVDIYNSATGQVVATLASVSNISGYTFSASLGQGYYSGTGVDGVNNVVDTNAPWWIPNSTSLSIPRLLGCWCLRWQQLLHHFSQQPGLRLQRHRCQVIGNT